jgi:hypothetical protein
MKRARPLVAVFLLMVMLNAPTTLACGPFAVEAIFVYTVHPAYPLERFASGEIGIVQPSYARSYFYVAYRYLAGSTFNDAEQKALVELWKDRLEYRWSLGSEEWIKDWTAERKRVIGIGEPPQIDVYRNREKPNEYESFLNCQKDAFENASKTLNDRLSKYGADSPTVRAWVDAQDQVFANCSEGQHIPQPLESTADTLARADRNYQIAAANFYAGNFDAAKNAFTAVADDTSSPWQPGASYLVARTLVRKAGLGPAETRDASLTEAEVLLKKIVADKKLERSHESADRLANLVRLRLHPEERTRELAQSLVNPKNNPSLKQQLWDYTVLLDKFLETAEGETKTPPPQDIRKDDLTDWIATIEEDSEQTLARAVEKWEQTHSDPWLINALSKMKGTHPKTGSFVSEALKVKSGSAAYPSARFHAVRLLFESGKTAESRAMIDELLKTGKTLFDESSLNLLLGQRMILATNLAEFLTFAPRVPAALSWNDDGREIPTVPEELADAAKLQAGKPFFDDDAANAINRQLPLSILKEAAKSSILPEGLRRDVVQATWLRDVILGDNKTAVELTPTLNRLVPGLSSLLDPFLAAQTEDDQRFTALYAWLKFPGLEPVVDEGVARETLSEQDIYRDNWWCDAAYPILNKPAVDSSNEAKPITPTTDATLGFLSPAERSAGRKERLALEAIGPAPNYLCQQMIQWATKSPNDPRVPEGLHLAVRTTRYGCTNKESGRWSKTAFDLLHGKYPNSTWAKKTPYWFKD